MSIIILIFMAFPVFAIQPRWSYTRVVNFYMYFDGEEGSLEGSVTGYSDVTEMEGTITLYRKNILGIWVETGDSWGVYSGSNYLSIEAYFDATSGTKYKAELELEVFSGSNSETITDTATGTCP